MVANDRLALFYEITLRGTGPSAIRRFGCESAGRVTGAPLPITIPWQSFIAVALRQPARAPCTRRTSPASSGRLAPSALRAARVRRRHAEAPATDRLPMPTSCRR
jgi:hypothetical protein